MIRDEDVIYIAHLPGGPITVLKGVAALIWSEACAGDRETVAFRVAEAIDPPTEGIDRDIDEFVAALVGRGLLRVSVD